MRVTMNGTGCAGLLSVACFADFDNFVTCIYKVPFKIERAEMGEISVCERPLEVLITRNVREGRLAIGLAGAEAIMTADAMFRGVETTHGAGPTNG